MRVDAGIALAVPPGGTQFTKFGTEPKLELSSSGGGLFDERPTTQAEFGALSFLGPLLRSNRSPCLAKDKQMKRVAVLLLLLSLAIAAPAFARGSHSSGSHSRAARGVARNKHRRIERSSAAKHAFERQHPCPSTG